MDSSHEPNPQSSHSAARERINRTEVGRQGEAVASEYLSKHGFRILERNWRCRHGEIDLICEVDETLVFVEVRSRTNPSKFGTAIEAVTPRKCRQVRETASFYMKHHRQSERSIRFDVVAVTFLTGLEPELLHISNAF
ncbi:MAG: YraN family protein [Candidatus Cohnella colombiensis]|uniref:UPF0102 protein P0Y55_09230 n=1 Tax=Candidatus Cohnella colombiensis TaxID=3121368 RepID=A0AA95F0E3_9BACL|nr:MAG: YraN family protein [Cohnella sp.]